MPPAYHFGDFKLDRTLLQHRGSLVPLAPKAVDLLYLLVSRAPDTISKEEIFEAVWPGTFVVESSLTRNMSVIRKALEDREGGPFIETVPKRGYRFIAPLNPGAPSPPSAPPPPPPVESRRNWLAWSAGAFVPAAGGVWWLWRKRAPASRASEAEQIGRSLLLKTTPEQARQSLAWMERAVKENPQSATAWAGLAEVLLTLPTLAVGGVRESYPRALAAAQTAVRLDESDATAHATLAAVRMSVEWDYPGAEKSLARARALDAGNLTGFVYSIQFLIRVLRLRDARALVETATRQHPLVPLLALGRPRISYYLGEFGRAEREFAAVLERAPDYGLAHYYFALTLGFLGRHAEAEKHLAQAGLHERVLRADRGWLELLQGRRAPAEAAYADVTRAVNEGRMGPSARLLLATVLGDFDTAFACVNASLRERSTDLFQIRLDPRFAGLRRQPRYAGVEVDIRQLLGPVTGG